MKESFYTLIPQEGSDVDEKELSRTPARPSLSRRWISLLIALTSTLMISMTGNGYLIYRQFFRPWDFYDSLPSKYAQLRRNMPTEIVAHNSYDSPNRTIQDAAWNDRDMEPWELFVALDDGYTIAQGLPHSQRWPWDLAKGVYILTAAHELHCVRVLRVFVNESHDGVLQAEQTWGYQHVLHCLNVLRDSVMCHADDTPLYIGRLHKNVLAKDPKAGVGTVKMCRDWKKLLAWSHSRSACFRPVLRGEQGYDDIQRYKYCPDGARPWEAIEGA